MLNPTFFNTIFVFPILNLLVAFYKFFSLIKLPGAFGFAIITLTLFIRLVLHPFFKQQMTTAKKMQELKPHLDKLSVVHKKDPKKLQEEQFRLYQKAGINPASGCLFMIIQIPVFIALYNTLSIFLSNGGSAKVLAQINKALYFPFLELSKIDPWFFGFNLALSPSQAKIWYYYFMPLITAYLQYRQAHSMSATPVVSDEKKKPSPQGAEKNKESSADFQKIMNTQMKYMFPILIGWFSFSLPVGLSLYWNIFSVFSIMQHKNVK